MRESFTDPEILDLTICLSAFLGLGRTLRVLGITETSLTRRVDVWRRRRFVSGVAV